MSKKTDKKIRALWGKAKKRTVPFELIGQYSTYKKSKHNNILEEKTLTDIDFYSFFEFVDRTNSAVGQQFLWHKFLTNDTDQKYLDKQENFVQFYSSEPENRLKSEIILKKLAKANDYYFPYLIFSELPKKKYKTWLIVCLQVAMILSVILCFTHPTSFLFALLLFTINLGLHYFHKSRIGNFAVYFSRLGNLSSTLRKLIPLSPLDEKKKSLCISDCKSIEKVTSQVAFLKTDNLQNSEFGSLFWFAFELIKVLTLSEIIVFNKLVDQIKSSRAQIESVFVEIAEIDLALSICSLRDGLTYFSIPNFLKEVKELEVKELYHPLVTDCVPNDIMLKDKSLLLTGSNMAGKSTFIKALNLNALSSQVLNTSFSKSYSAPKWQLLTSMTIKDNLNENSSYYLEEVSSIGQLIKSSQESDKQYLFTIDEIFKGTNTIERISTAKAILKYLNNHKHMVLVSTHDIELTKLLQEGFDLYFFQESVAGEALSFDYQLNKGTLMNSNAIKLLEVCGYPKKITDEARVLAAELRDEKTGYIAPVEN